MIERLVAILAGAAMLAAVAHVTVLATSGYGTPHAWLTWAVAVGVACGSWFCGRALWSGRTFVALGLMASMVAGEAYNLLQTANRLTAGTEATQAPKREHAKAYTKAADEVNAAQAKVNSPPTTSERLKKAEVAKAAADQAVTDRSAERGCREHCRALLQKAVDDAADEVKAARAELEKTNAGATTGLEKAKATLAGMRAPESASPFADRIGMPAWAFDVMVAALGSFAVNGLACFLIGFGAHAQPERTEKKRPLDRLFARWRRKPAAADLPGNVVSLVAKTPGKDGGVSAKPMISFLAQCVPKTSDSDKAEWGAMFKAYLPWHARVAPGKRPYTAAEFGAVLAAICKKADIPIRSEGEFVYCMGRKLQ